MIVRTELASEFPDALDRIQIRAVRGQERTREHRPVRREKWLQEGGVMVPGVVQDEDESAVGTVMPQELAQEGGERHRIELRGELAHQLAAAEMDRPEERHGFARRRVGMPRPSTRRTPRMRVPVSV